MAERAKLRYHGKAYYDEDMIAIAKKELNFNGLKFVGYKLDREKHLLLAQGYRTNKKDKNHFIKFIEFINKIEMAGSQKNQLTFTEKNREKNKRYKLEYDEEFEIYKFMEI